MDFPKIVKDLQAAGMRQREISEQTGISQPNICQIGSGKFKKIFWENGDALIRLHRIRCPGEDVEKSAS